MFESQLTRLSTDEKESFPICQYKWDSEIIRGIFPSVDVFKQHRNSIEYLIYNVSEEKSLFFILGIFFLLFYSFRNV